MPPSVAYFCMEYGLHESFPIYAGGLGILAGDFMKSAHALGLRVVGVGLRWARGYSRQRIGEDGVPVDEFPEYQADFLEDTGARVRVRVAAREVEARVWRTERWGNAPLFLLEPVDERGAWITHRIDELRRLGASCELVDAEMRAIGGDPFNMTVAGLRLSRRANAVSQLHGEVSRAMWREVEGASEIIAITNGVHVPTWQDARVSQDDLWGAHQALKHEMLDAVAQRTGVRLDP